MQQFEAWWRLPVQAILLAFGFVNAGVPLSSVGAVTSAVTLSLIVGNQMIQFSVLSSQF